jgi:hypothetical protein
VVGVAERFHPFALELSGDGGEVDTSVCGLRKRLLGFACIGIDRPRDLAVIGKCSQRLLRHRADDVGSDQLCDVENIGEGRILRPRARPQRSLALGAEVRQAAPPIAGEAGEILLVGDARVGDGDDAAQR